MDKWIKADKNTFPKGKCFAIFLEPSFGGYSLEVTTAYFDNPKDYKDERDGKGWLAWDRDREIMVTHFMEIPEAKFELTENTQKGFREKFSNLEFGIVPNEAINYKA